MNRQHAIPLLLPLGAQAATPLVPIGYQTGSEAVSEADIQAFIHAHPECLPITEIDPIFSRPVPICRELVTPAGPIDNFMVTTSGLPVLVECKLWRNPEARREVVGQILDYAKELSRWSSSDLQREVRKRVSHDGNPLLDMVRAVDPNVDEVQFNDALTNNLRRGRFLLLIVGDGIREGVEAIADYLRAHMGLHFSLGLVELPIYALPDGSRLVAPRVLARTLVVVRNVIGLAAGSTLEDDQEDSQGGSVEVDADRAALGDQQKQFWIEFLAGLNLDDPEQPRPNPARLGYITLNFPAPSGSSWLTVFRELHKRRVGVFLSASRGTPGEAAMFSIIENWGSVGTQLGGTARLEPQDPYGRPRIVDSRSTGPLDNPDARKEAFEWLSERVNTFVNVLRPLVRSAVADSRLQGED